MTFDRQFRGQGPGKRTLTESSAYDAQDFVGGTPGKRTLVQGLPPATAGYKTGNAHIDQGAACDVNPEAADCFLGDGQRERLIDHISRHVQTAQTNYKLALVELKVDELLKKEEDLHWVVALALDLAGGHLTTVIGTALKAVQARGAKYLVERQLVAAAASAVSDSSWLSRAEAAIAAATPARIDLLVRAGLTTASVKTKAAGKAVQNHASASRKTETLAYIDQLRDRCDVAFNAFFNTLAAQAFDAELIAAYDGLQPEHHSVGQYVAALKDNLSRFHASGVMKIGRREEVGAYGSTTIRDTRVVYVQDIHGKRVPWYQYIDGSYSPGLARPGDPMYETIDPDNAEHKKRWASFGPRHAEQTKLDRPVPAEFRDIAVARSEARWGATLVIDDGYVSMLKLQGIDPATMRDRIKDTPPATPEPPISRAGGASSSWGSSDSDLESMPPEWFSGLGIDQGKKP